MLKNKRYFNILLAVLLLSGFLITSWLSYRVAHNSMTEQIEKDSLPLTSDNIYSEIQNDLFKPLFISSLMAQDTFVRDWKMNGEHKPENLVKYLKEIQKKYNTITSYFVSNASLNYYHSSGILKQVSKTDPQDAWYFRIMNSPKEQLYEVNIDTDTANKSNMVVFVNYKVFDYNNNFIGVTGVGLALKTVKKLIANYQKNYQRTVYFLDNNGDIALSGDDFTDNPKNTLQPGLAPHIKIILNSQKSSLEYKNHGKTVYLNSRYIEEFHWHLVVEQYASATEKKLTNTFIINIIFSIIVTLSVLLIAHFTFNSYQRRLLLMATTDKLSGLLNRQAFEPILESHIQSSKRKNNSLSLILLDIDNFKSVNDNFGHLTGDKIIKQVSNICQAHSRESDAVCRWGGEEFLLMLPDTDITAAIAIAQRIQNNLQQSNYYPKVTASFGVSQYHQPELANSLLNRADKALYAAKGKGRNRIESAE